MQDFEPYLSHWRLTPDGDEIATPGARLLPVRVGAPSTALRAVPLPRFTADAEPAILKLISSPEERGAGAVLDWWQGDGAARVLAHDDTAVLMERATGTRSLAEMARGGRDDAACRILCAAAARLHTKRDAPPPGLPKLADWFGELWPAAERHGGILARSAEAARELLAEPREIVVLHGDLHHDNVLDFGPRGWLAIDPKGILGERGFDYANIFTNPDLADPTRPVATEPGRFSRRLEVVAEASGPERERLLRWILAWTGLSAAWFLGDDDPMAEIDLTIAHLAAAEIDR